MGKRSQSRGRWPKRHDAPVRREIHVWICAECRARGCQLVTCADGKQRCVTCKAGFDRLRPGALGSMALVRQEG